jgi:hypothetical protein
MKTTIGLLLSPVFAILPFLAMKYAFLALLVVLALFVVPSGRKADSTDTILLSQHAFGLDKRYPDASVNRVFKENILLTLAYARAIVSSKETINWSAVDSPFTWTYTLNPGQTVAYHDGLLDAYKGKTAIFTPSHFNSTEGFISDGWLIGDGTCHLASLMDWVARDAGLDVVAPTNHDFHLIPEVPKEYGVAIFSDPNGSSTSQLQNLYIKNTRPFPVQFVFKYNGDTLNISSYSVL